jgi:hypothetical protein
MLNNDFYSNVKYLMKQDIDEQVNPLILTSSLDCSFRLWCLEGEDRGVCLKEFYLYNCAECFDISSTSFVFGLG